jgi:hypothetical protein
MALSRFFVVLSINTLINFTYLRDASEEMKRGTASISFMIVSTLILFALSIVPHHHHHEGIPCVFPAQCEHSGSSNDTPPDDHAAAHDSQHGPSCVAGAKYTPSSNEGLIKCKSTSLPPDSPASYLAVNLNDHALIALPSTYRHRHAKALLYQSAHVKQPHGLRAPPLPLV